MKRSFAIIVTALLMSVSASSQNLLLEPIVYKGERAFIGNEGAMDKISETFINYKKCLSSADLLKLEITRLENLIAKARIETDIVRNDKKFADMQITIIKRQMAIQSEKHDAEVLYLKDKAKGKFTSFLYGSGVGALLMAILVIVK